MSPSVVSFAALFLASYTWWSSPPTQSVQVYEVPAAAEFSCSARCSTPAPPQSSPVAPSTVFPFFWVVASCLLSATLAWRVWPRGPPSPAPVHSTILTLPASPAGPRFAEEHEERVQEGEAGLGVTPQRLRLQAELGVAPQQLRLRRIRALIDGSESGALRVRHVSLC